MAVESRWEPSVRMKDRWHENPMILVLFVGGLMWVFWGGTETDTLRPGQVVLPAIAFWGWWTGRDRQLAKRVEVLAGAVQGLQAVTQALLQRDTQDAATPAPRSAAGRADPS